MENFTMYNPTKVYFGKDVLDQLGEVVLGLGKRVLMLYGKGSIHKIGVYDMVKAQLSQAGVNVWEYHGIKSNPLIEDVDAAVSLGKAQQADVVLAIGGGSVIDTAKIVAAAIPADVPGWDLVTRKVIPNSALPVIAVLTLAATGSEMNHHAVVQNEALGVKTSFSSPFRFRYIHFLIQRLP